MKNKRSKEIWSINRKGEIINECLNRNIRKYFKADTPFDNMIVPYLIMAFCAVIDGFIFYSLFSKLSYDSPMLLWVQIAAFLFGYDVIPVFIGIQYKRLRQGLTKDKFVLIMALVVCGLACVMNIILRIMTIDLLSPPDDMITSYIGASAVEAAESGIDSNAVALTIFGIGAPIVTSIGSCMISFITYNPLTIKKKRLCEMIEDTKDDIRRFDAIISEYDSEVNYFEQLELEDQMKYEEMNKMQKMMVVGYCEYVRDRLKEHLGNPSSNSLLSQEIYENICSRLDEELEYIDKTVSKYH